MNACSGPWSARPTRSQVLAQGALLVGVGLLAACVPSGEGGSQATAAQETGPATWLTYGTSGPERMQAFEKIRTAFLAATPGRNVELMVVDGAEAIAKLQALVAAGTPPDLSIATPIWVAGLADKGMFQPLEPFMSKDRSFKLEDFEPPTIEAGRWKRKLYLLPLFTLGLIMKFNIPLLRKHGVAPPTDQWTWATLQNAALKLIERSSDRTEVFGFTFGGGLNDLLPWIWANGGDAFDRGEEPTKSTMSDPKTMAALQYLVDLRQRHRVVPNTADRAGRTISFNSGTIAIEINNNLPTTALEFEWDAQVVPKGTAGRFSFVGGLQNGIVTGAKSPQTAWAFLRFMHGPVGNRELIAARQGLPSYKPSYQDFLRLPPPPQNRQAVVTTLGIAKALPKAAALEPNYAAYTTAFNEMFDGKKSVQETCADLDRLMNGALARK